MGREAPEEAWMDGGLTPDGRERRGGWHGYRGEWERGTILPYRPGDKHQLMCAGVTAKSFECFFPPTPECVVFRLDKGLR